MKFKEFKQCIINNPELFDLYNFDQKGLELLDNPKCNSSINVTINFTTSTDRIIDDYSYFDENPKAISELIKCKNAKDFITLCAKIHLESGTLLNYVEDYKLIDFKVIQ